MGREQLQRKPHLMDWVLQQDGPRRKVLLEVFTGVPERECARRLGMPLDEVNAIVRDAVDNGPVFVEDEYVMSYHATSSVEEFCRTTGQGEGVYKLLSLRYPKRRPKVEHSVAAPVRQEAGSASRAAKATSRPRAKSRARKAAPKPKASEPVQAEAPAPKPPRDEEAARRRRDERRAARELERARRLSERGE